MPCYGHFGLILCSRGGGVVDTVSSCSGRMQGFKKFAAMVLDPLGCGDIHLKRSTLCYHAEFGHCTSNYVHGDPVKHRAPRITPFKVTDST